VGTAGGLLGVVPAHAAAILSSPFGTEALVWDVHLAQLNQQAETNAYLGVVARQEAEKQAETQAYLEVEARVHAAAVAAAVRAPVPPPPATAAGDPWASLRQCESDDNYGDDTGNGYYGAYQFTVGTWRSLGFGGLPSEAPPAQQDQAAQELQARRGWGQWPSCAARLGLI
jgi:resuscitation-promoting factor RpfB